MASALILRADHLGDLVLTTPLMRALHHGGWTVEVMAPAAHLPALEGLEFVHALHPFPETAPVLSLSSQLRKRACRLLVVPFAKPRALLAAGTLAGVPQRIAMWAGAPGRLLGWTCLRSGHGAGTRHMADIWLDPARHLGLDPGSPLPELWVTAEERRWAREQVPLPYLILHPGCGGNTCNLPPAVYAEATTRLLRETSLRIVISGSRHEGEDFARPFEAVRSEAGPRLVWAFGAWSLRQFMAVIAEARGLVSVGTGPLHLAAGLGTPTVSPFCRREGVCAAAWGNQRGPAWILEPEKALCAGRPQAGYFCDFKQQIDAFRLVEAIRGLLSD